MVVGVVVGVEAEVVARPQPSEPRFPGVPLAKLGWSGLVFPGLQFYCLELIE